MEYSLDSYFWNNQFNESFIYSGFIYDNRRICAKLYLLFKIAGLILYTSTLSLCYVSDLFITMVVFMFLATINSVRYEYAHYKRYGTIFSSINEFDEWKKTLYPKSRIVFSIIELIIKIVFFVKTFPPQFSFQNFCEIGESIFKIHILAILSLYIILVILSICACATVNFNSNSQHFVNSNIRIEAVSFPLPVLNNIQNEECSICLDIDNTNSWTILPCCHKFHEQCISIWLRTNHTCPICRLHIN